jgi:hypothetical protein
MVNRALLGEESRQMKLEGPHLALQSPDPPVELALGAERGKVASQVSLGEPPEVPLAAEAGPLGEDCEGEDLRVGDERRATGPRSVRGVGGLPPVFGEDVQ